VPGTRLYFDSQTAPPVSPGASPEWGHSNLRIIRRMNLTPQNSVLVTTATTYDAADHLVDADSLFVSLVSPPLNAGTIAGQFISLQIQALMALTSDNVVLSWKLFLIDSGGVPVAGGTMLALARATDVFATSLTNRGITGTTTSVTASSGHRLCLELGYGGKPRTSLGIDGHNASMRLGDQSTGTDLPVDETSTGLTLRPWLQFTSTISFQTPTTILSQDSIEVLHEAGQTLLSQDSIEALWDYGTTLLSQDSVEFLYDEGGHVTDLSQDSVEFLYSEGIQTRLSQDSVEFLYDENALVHTTRLTQDSFEVLYGVAAAPVVTITAEPDGQISNSGGTLGQISSATQADGQIASSGMELGSIENV
jgi:hypothetical protein